MEISLLKHAYCTVLCYSKEIKRAGARKFLAFLLALDIIEIRFYFLLEKKVKSNTYRSEGAQTEEEKE
jgi:hypothetical protein